MSSFRAASLVSVPEVDALIAKLGDQLMTCETQKGMLAMRLHSGGSAANSTATLLSQVERSIRDVKSAVKELTDEKAKLVAARHQAQACKDADKKRRAPAAATAAGTKLGKFVVPEWIAGRSPALLVARKDGKTVQTIDLAKRDCFILGRQPELAHIVLEHASVSRQHVVIIHGSPVDPSKPPAWHIIDLASAHGTGISAPPASAASSSSAKEEEKKKNADNAPTMKRLKPDEPTALEFGTSFRIGKSSRVYTVEADNRGANKRRKRTTADDTAKPNPAADPKASAEKPAEEEEEDEAENEEEDDDDDEQDDDDEEDDAGGGTLGADQPYKSSRPA